MQPQQYEFTDPDGAYARTLWLLPGPEERPHRLCLFLDAEHYLRDMDCVPLLNSLMQQAAIPPMTCLFVSHQGGEDRQRDFVCNTAYSKWLAEDVVGWARERANLQADDHVICGLSLSGLAGAYLALHYPKIFSYALCQSGSFWWLADRELELPETNQRFWLSVGDQETETNVKHTPALFQKISQIAGVEWAAQRFRSLGATVEYQQYQGGHAIAPWREELPTALTWLLCEPTKSKQHF